jgi:hypothetical protein
MEVSEKLKVLAGLYAKVFGETDGSMSDETINANFLQLPEEVQEALKSLPIEAHMHGMAEGAKLAGVELCFEDMCRNHGLTTEGWFAALSYPEERLSVQFGVHLEEVAEMFPEITSGNIELDAKMALIGTLLNEVGAEFKAGKVELKITNNAKFEDSLLDQLVTARGTAVFAGYNVREGVARVDWANFTKFVNKVPVYKEGAKVAKVAKGPYFWDPDK